MAIAVDATSSGQITSAGTTLTISHTCTGSDLVLVVSVITSAGSDPSSVTYNSVAMTKAVGDTTTTSIWYLANPATGANNVVVTHGSSVKMGAGCISFTGANTSAPIGVTGTATATDTNPTKTVTTIYRNSYLLDATFVNGNPTTTPDGSQTLFCDLYNTGDNYRQEASRKQIITAGSATMQYTLNTSALWRMSVAEIREKLTFIPQITII